MAGRWRIPHASAGVASTSLYKLVAAFAFILSFSIRVCGFDGYVGCGSDAGRHLAQVLAIREADKLGFFWIDRWGVYASSMHVVVASVATACSMDAAQTLAALTWISLFLNSLSVLAVYWLCSKLGRELALIASALVAFSINDLLVYSWGGYPTAIGFFLVALLLAFVSSRRMGVREAIVIFLILSFAASLHLSTPAIAFTTLLLLTLYALVMKRRSWLWVLIALTAATVYAHSWHQEVNRVNLFAESRSMASKAAKAAVEGLRVAETRREGAVGDWRILALKNFYLASYFLPYTALASAGMILLIVGKPGMSSGQRAKEAIAAWVAAPHLLIASGVVSEYAIARFIQYLTHPILCLSALGLFALASLLRSVVEALRLPISPIRIRALGLVLIAVFLLTQGVWVTLMARMVVEKSVGFYGISKEENLAYSFVVKRGAEPVLTAYGVGHWWWAYPFTPSHVTKPPAYVVVERSASGSGQIKLFDSGDWVVEYWVEGVGVKARGGP